MHVAALHAPYCDMLRLVMVKDGLYVEGGGLWVDCDRGVVKGGGGPPP